MKPIVFLGGGRITTALVAGLRLAGYNQPIVVHDRHAKKLRELKRSYDIVAEPDLCGAVESASLLIVAVRPDSVRGLLKEIAQINYPLNAVSLAAGVPLSTLKAGLKSPVRWARAMPSPACRSGRGLTALTFPKGFPTAERSRIRDLFSLVGGVMEIPQRQFDAFTVTFSCSHGYHALNTLIEAAESIGLDPATAQAAAAHALADGILAWRDSHLPLDELLKEAATPGGTAAAVMEKMNRSGYRRLVENGLRAGVKQAQKNARK